MSRDLNISEVKWCSSCLTMSTRPRITFDLQGRCNACLWVDQKNIIDWSDRSNQLLALLDRHRRKDGHFDCIVPLSGGKDGSYVSYMLKHKYGMNPLGVTVTPALPLELGERNLRSFVQCGYNHLSVNPDYEAMRTLNRQGFIEMGFPYYGWLIAIMTAPLKIAKSFGINLIFYGEDGEVEYGGSAETSANPIYGIDYQKRIYLEGGYDKVVKQSALRDDQLYFFEFPEGECSEIELTHWSYFENWDPYRNYLVAKEFCGLEEAESANAGTFTNFSQNDQKLYALHTYLMYLKYGFGRANQDACIEIRRGAMVRDQAINLVNMYDGLYPHEFLEDYLQYFEMTQTQFESVLDNYANQDLFYKLDGYWQPKFKVK